MSLRTPKEWGELLVSALVWHYAGAIALLVLVIVLGFRFGTDLVATSSGNNDVMATKQFELKALDLQTAPLRGLQGRIQQSRKDIGDFYSKRIPTSYSSIAGRLGDLQIKAGVRLSRIQYTQGPPGRDLTEISMDAGISGSYPQIMRFVNALERDQTFFVIRAMSLTGQQGGLVNLRLRVSTWMRPSDAVASGIPPTQERQSE